MGTRHKLLIPEIDVQAQRAIKNVVQLKLTSVSGLRQDLDVIISCEDNLKFMRRLPNESMNLIVTSPPYNLGKEYEVKRSQDRYIEEQVACIAEAVRLLHPNGSICWQVGNHVQNGEIFPLDIILYEIFKNAGLQLRNRIVWTFGHGLHCQKRFSGRHEAILWFTKTENYTFNLHPVVFLRNTLRRGALTDPNTGDVWRLVQHDSEAYLGKN